MREKMQMVGQREIGLMGMVGPRIRTQGKERHWLEGHRSKLSKESKKYMQMVGQIGLMGMVGPRMGTQGKERHWMKEHRSK